MSPTATTCDWARDRRVSWLWPAAFALVGAGWLVVPDPWGALLAAAGFAVAGGLCLGNTLRCQRTHCATECSVPPAPDPMNRCATMIDNDCDRCENMHCCSTRFGCYDVAACSDANDAFDVCLMAAGASQPAITDCWNTFENSGPAAGARVDCQRTYCRTECELP